MSRGQTAKYQPAKRPQAGRVYPPYLCTVPSESSQAVGVEAAGVARLFEKLTASFAATETLTHAPIEHLEGNPELVGYEHVEGQLVRTMKVRYRNIGRLPPREVVLDDIDIDE